MNKGIYAIICIANGKIYIGSSMNFKSRKRSHFSKLKALKYSIAHPQLQGDYNLYGSSKFKFVIVEEIDTDSHDFLLQKEEDYIIRFGTFFEDMGYNVALPIQKKYRKWFINEYGEDFLRELIHPNEDLLNKKEWIADRMDMTKSIVQIGKDNKIIKIWKNKEEIKLKFGVRDSCIRKILLNSWLSKINRRKLWKNSVWITEDKYDDNFNYSILWERKKRIPKPKLPKVYKAVEERNIKRNPISLQNIVTKEIRHFKSQSDVKKELGFNVIPLIKGWKAKGGGKKAIITQWKGWQILK